MSYTGHENELSTQFIFNITIEYVKLIRHVQKTHTTVWRYIKAK